jgi:hypothetical protein
MGKQKFSHTVAVEILTRYMAGSTCSQISTEYGCAPGYPSMLKSRFGSVDNLKNKVLRENQSTSKPRAYRTRGEVKERAPTRVVAKQKVDCADLARRYAAGEFDRHELSRRMRGESQ